MATGNNETNPDMQLTLFEEASTPVEPASSTERPLASPSVVEPELASGQASSVQEDEDEVMTPEQEADFDRNMEFGNFNRTTALGRAGVKRNVEVEPVRPRRRSKSTKPQRRRYVPRNDPDYQAAQWNER